jgi:hypothetical protein
MDCTAGAGAQSGSRPFISHSSIFEREKHAGKQPHSFDIQGAGTGRVGYKDSAGRAQTLHAFVICSTK